MGRGLHHLSACALAGVGGRDVGGNAGCASREKLQIALNSQKAEDRPRQDPSRHRIPSARQRARPAYSRARPPLPPPARPPIRPARGTMGLVVRPPLHTCSENRLGNYKAQEAAGRLGRTRRLWVCERSGRVLRELGCSCGVRAEEQLQARALAGLEEGVARWRQARCMHALGADFAKPCRAALWLYSG